MTILTIIAMNCPIYSPMGHNQKRRGCEKPRMTPIMKRLVMYGKNESHASVFPVREEIKNHNKNPKPTEMRNMNPFDRFFMYLFGIFNFIKISSKKSNSSTHSD